MATGHSIHPRPRPVLTDPAVCSALILLCALLPGAANASTVTTTFNVTASVSDACSTSATDLAFGSYEPLSSSANDSTNTITVRCTLGTSYQIGLNQGTYGSSVTARKMQRTSETELLNYALYRDVARTLNWGETLDTDTVSAVGTGVSVNHTVYGRIAAEQNVPTGSYTDLITVTVTY